LKPCLLKYEYSVPTEPLPPPLILEDGVLLTTSASHGTSVRDQRCMWCLRVRVCVGVWLTWRAWSGADAAAFVACCETGSSRASTNAFRERSWGSQSQAPLREEAEVEGSC
jgi:hypothetical protein